MRMRWLLRRLMLLLLLGSLAGCAQHESQPTAPQGRSFVREAAVPQAQRSSPMDMPSWYRELLHGQKAQTRKAVRGYW